MAVATSTCSGIEIVISQLQKQKEELTIIYNTAILKGEKMYEVKNLYINLKEIDRKLAELQRISF